MLFGRWVPVHHRTILIHYTRCCINDHYTFFSSSLSCLYTTCSYPHFLFKLIGIDLICYTCCACIHYVHIHTVHIQHACCIYRNIIFNQKKCFWWQSRRIYVYNNIWLTTPHRQHAQFSAELRMKSKCFVS
jgi:hypothetical protein